VAANAITAPLRQHVLAALTSSDHTKENVPRSASEPQAIVIALPIPVIRRPCSR